MLTVINLLQPLLQPLKVQMSRPLGVQLPPEVLDPFIPLVLRLVHLHLALGNPICYPHGGGGIRTQGQ